MINGTSKIQFLPQYGITRKYYRLYINYMPRLNFLFVPCLTWKLDFFRGALKQRKWRTSSLGVGVAGLTCYRRLIAQCWRPDMVVERPSTEAYKLSK